MLRGLAILLCFQWLGHVIAQVADLPIPGAIVGMVMLLVALFARGLPKDLESTSTRLLGFLPMFILPASVGIVEYGPLLRQEALAISLALGVSLGVSFAITPLLFRFFLRVFRSAP